MLLRSAEPTCEADNKATPLFARFAPLGRMSGRSLVDVRARDRGGSTLGSFWPAFRLVRHLATGHQHRNPIVTFMMVFVIQNTQSRDTQAMQLKLDELIRVNEMARNSLINLEEMSDFDVERMKAAFAALASFETSTSRSMQVADHPSAT